MASLNDLFHEFVSRGLRLFTGNYPNTARIAVDPQQTSFEENAQFRFFDPLDAVANANQIVYYVTIADPINLFTRNINLYQGGRRYRVYLADGSHTFTGSLTDVTDRITSMNTNLADSGLSSLPVSGATVSKVIGAGIFTAGSNPIDGTEVLTDGNANRASNSFSGSGERFGVAAGASFWLVMDGISGNGQPTSGNIKLIWEERF